MAKKKSRQVTVAKGVYYNSNIVIIIVRVAFALKDYTVLI